MKTTPMNRKRGLSRFSKLPDDGDPGGRHLLTPGAKENESRWANILHTRKQRSRSASLSYAFIFATRMVQFLYFLKSKFPAPSHLLCLYSSVCVGAVWKPHCWFSRVAAHLSSFLISVGACVVYFSAIFAYDLFCCIKNAL